MPDSPPVTLALEARVLLLELARESVRRAASGLAAPEVAGCRLHPDLLIARGCFVTLTSDDRLRGCIGNVEPRWPLWKAVLENARAAAIQDARFSPLRPEELDTLEIDISVLSSLEPLRFDTPEDLLARLRPEHDGVLLTLGARHATFLPQVWTRLPDKTRFLSQLALKAGAGPQDWRRADAVVHTYRVLHFSAADLAAEDPPPAGPLAAPPGTA